MSKMRLLLTTSLIGALIAAPAFAGKDKEENSGGSNDSGRYQEHLQQRHQMDMEMMRMMADTMTILRDINHQPSAEDKKRLTDMIKQLNEMMARHKEMGEKMMKHMNDKMGRPMMGGPGHDKH